VFLAPAIHAQLLNVAYHHAVLLAKTLALQTAQRSLTPVESVARVPSAPLMNAVFEPVLLRASDVPQPKLWFLTMPHINALVLLEISMECAGNKIAALTHALITDAQLRPQRKHPRLESHAPLLVKTKIVVNPTFALPATLVVQAPVLKQTCQISLVILPLADLMNVASKTYVAILALLVDAQLDTNPNQIFAHVPVLLAPLAVFLIAAILFAPVMLHAVAI
jgi:hypothetical protein